MSEGALREYEAKKAQDKLSKSYMEPDLQCLCKEKFEEEGYNSYYQLYRNDGK